MRPPYPPKDAPINIVGMKIPDGKEMPNVKIIIGKAKIPTMRRVLGSKEFGSDIISLMASSFLL